MDPAKGLLAQQFQNVYTFNANQSFDHLCPPTTYFATDTSKSSQMSKNFNH